jgi:hypothetical protein
MFGVRNKEANMYTPGIQCGATEIMTNESLWWQRQTALSEPPIHHGGTGKMDPDHSSGDGVQNTTTKLGMVFRCDIEERRLVTFIHKRRKRTRRFDAVWEKN